LQRWKAAAAAAASASAAGVLQQQRHFLCPNALHQLLIDCKGGSQAALLLVREVDLPEGVPVKSYTTRRTFASLKHTLHIAEHDIWIMGWHRRYIYTQDVFVLYPCLLVDVQ
jgi:hypothetical protein